jgi:hypothetical protein
MDADPEQGLIRPSQLYVGYTENDAVWLATTAGNGVHVTSKFRL